MHKAQLDFSKYASNFHKWLKFKQCFCTAYDIFHAQAIMGGVQGPALGPLLGSRGNATAGVQGPQSPRKL